MRKSRLRLLLAIFASSSIILAGLLTAFGSTARAEEPGTSHFQRTWERTDLPVATGKVSRTWMWGPEAFTALLTEEYAESPDGMRNVQYFDKSRMEITHPNRPDDGLWYVTNGLLVVEMITGQLQVGDTSFVAREPAGVNVAGDPDDENGPTYQSFAGLLAPVADRGQEVVISRITRDGSVVDDPALADKGIALAHYDEVTGHNIARPFWEFMTSVGTVYEDGQYVEDNLFPHPLYATGRPITEPYFADVKVLGTVLPVLMQCFERRCLTYTETNPPGFQVEAGNVGLHYFCWRYGYLPEGKGPCIDSSAGPDQPAPPPDDGGNDGDAGGDGSGGGNGSGDDDGGAGGRDGGNGSGGGSGGGNGSGDGDDDDGDNGSPTASPTASPTQTATSTSTTTATATATSTPAQTATASPTEPEKGDPAVDVLPLNFSNVSIGLLGGSFDLQVRARNTGTETDTINVRLRTTNGISTCRLDQTKSQTVAPGQNATFTFTQSCTLSVNLLLTYEATATINRPPGASDTETDTVLVSLNIGGGGGGSNPTPTAPAPDDNDPHIDVLPLNFGSATIGLLGGSFDLDVRVKNLGNQTESVRVNLRTTNGISTCSMNQTQTVSINPGQTRTVTFSQSCVLNVGLLLQYTATATVDRPPGDSDSDTLLIQIGLLSAPQIALTS